MLSGEGNEKGEKKNRSNQQKRNFALSAHFLSRFLCRCFARLQRNFLVTCFIEEMSYVFLFTFFLLPLIFTLMAASISHFLTAATKFSCCSTNKKMSPSVFFISRSSSLSLFISLSFAGLSPTFSFSLCFSIFQICGHDN